MRKINIEILPLCSFTLSLRFPCIIQILRPLAEQPGNCALPYIHLSRIFESQHHVINLLIRFNDLAENFNVQAALLCHQTSDKDSGASRS